MSAPELTAQVECGKGFKADVGSLTLSKNHLRFETASGVAFDIAVESIEKIVWHWYSFGAAFEATIGGKSYFLSFMPRGAGLGTWYESLGVGRCWRAALEGKQIPVGPSIFATVFMAVYWVVRLFLLAISAILALATAIDEGTSQTYRILGGVMAAMLAIYIVLFIVTGVQSVLASRRK